MLKHMIDLEELSYKTAKQISQIPTDREGLTKNLKNYRKVLTME